ncbi:MAG: histidine kinase [Bacteroidota bacterium]
MTKLFIHNVFFRLIGPIFVGITIYLLILLLNNSIGLVDDLFANQELYLCIGLVYAVFEFVRAGNLIIHKTLPKLSFPLQILIQAITGLTIMVTVIWVCVSYYYSKYLGYEPSQGELWTFFSIYGFTTILYMTLHFSHLFLYQENKMKIEEEGILKEGLDFEFRNFKREMNPTLLLESLESLIALVDDKQDVADELIDELSVVYRYILGSKSAELVSIEDELETSQHLINLFWYQGREIDFQNNVKEGMCVPGVLLQVVEWLVKSSIHSTVQPVTIEISTLGNTLIIESERKAKLNSDELDLTDFERAYSFYSNDQLAVDESEGYTLVKIPLLVESEAAA